MESQIAVTNNKYDYKYKGINVNVWHPVTLIREHYLNLNIINIIQYYDRHMRLGY